MQYFTTQEKNDFPLTHVIEPVATILPQRAAFITALTVGEEFQKALHAVAPDDQDKTVQQEAEERLRARLSTFIGKDDTDKLNLVIARFGQAFAKQNAKELAA